MKRNIIVPLLVLIFLLMVSLCVRANENYIVKHYSIKDGMSQNTVMAILQDKQGYMWFGTWDGLNRFDGYNFQVYKAKNNGVEMCVNNRVNFIYEDDAEQIWWSTYDGHYFKIDKARKNISGQPYDSLPVGLVQKMADADKSTRVDAHGIIWQADDTEGVLRYRNGQWKRFTPPLDNKYAGQLRKHFFLLQDNRGRTWVNPTGGGWSYYDYEKDELMYPIKGLTNMIHTAYVDRDGHMWVATYDGGVECIDMDSAPYVVYDMRTHERENGEVRAFIKMQEGRVLPLVKSQTNVYCALDSKHGILYGTKGNGLKNMTTGVTIATSHSDIYDIEEGSDGTLYVATYGGGVNIIPWNAEKNAWESARIIGDGMKVRDIEMVGKTLWCGTTTGVLRVNISDGKTEIIPSFDIRTVHYCNGKIWFGTFGGGLYMANPQSKSLQLEHVETFHDIILSMAGDGKNLWFVSESDIVQLNVKTGALVYHDALAGEDNSYFTEAEAVRTTDGTILFGYSNGYCAFDITKDYKSTHVPQMIITHCEVQGQNLEGDTISVEYKSNVTIKYAAMEYVGADKIVYFYKMEGVDDEWKQAQNQRQVVYSNLRHGTYVFHVRSTNREGTEVNNEKQLVIYVAKPLWLQWWAVLLYAVVFVGVFGGAMYVVVTYNMLRQKIKIEQQVTDIKFRFFTNISHELRTPLTLIVGPVENILQTERINQSVRNQLEIVLSNSRRMLRMVNQLLEFRKVQNQKMKLKVQQTVLSELVEDTCANFKKEAYDKHINFTIENKAADTTVWVDRTRIDTILWNILSNAFKFTASGKSIRVIIEEKPGFVILSVQDEGVGIPIEKRSVLFERFSSNNELNSNTATTGTGIGMNLTKELVDLHQGHIEVESEVGKGTTIIVMLHKGKDHFDSSNVEIVTDSQFVRQMVLPTFEDRISQLECEMVESRYTILVVDDSQDMKQFLTSILEKEYAVESAEDGESAKRIIQTKPVDLIITDLMMPNVDGLELTQYVKENPETDHIPVILLTAKTAIESRLLALQKGADDYIAKPFEPEYLRARVDNIMAQRKQLEQSYRQRLMRLESPKTADKHNTGDVFLAKLLDIMDRQLDNNTLTVDDLVEEMGMGRTVFFNKLKTMTGLSPVEFVREIRIKRAAQLLEESKYNITEVTYMVGMNDSRYFAKCFKNTYGVTPSEYKHACLKKKEQK